MTTTAEGKKVMDAATKQQKLNTSLEKIFGELNPETKKRIGGMIKNLPRLKGNDKTYAIASTFAAILQDTGKLPGGLSRQEFNDTIGTFDLAMNWDNLSDVSKFTQGGKKIIDLANKYGDVEIPYAGSALSMASIGYNQYQLMNQWDNLSGAGKLVGIANTMSNAGQAYNLFNNMSSAAEATVTATKGGSAVANSFAQGAQTGQAGLEAGANIAGDAAAGVSEMSGAEILGNAAGVLAGAYGAYQMIDGFGTGGSAGRVSGSLSGAAVGGGIAAGGALVGMQMGAFAGPIGMAIGAVAGMAIGSINTGKSKEQGARDGYRDYFTERGVFEKPEGMKSHQVKLSDGTFYDVGIDGSGSFAEYNGEAKATADPSKLLQRDSENVRDDGKINPYDVDYTNDLDFFADHSLTALKYIMGGGADQLEKSGELGQMFGYMANGATSNAASREFNEENFSSTMANVRSMYANAGITNSDQAYNMLNQLKAEGKINEEQFNMAGQSIRTSFNNDFAHAQELNTTRWDGLDSEMVGGQEDFINQGEGAFGDVQPMEKPTTGSFSFGKPVSTETAEDGINRVTTYEDGTELTTLMGTVDQQPASGSIMDDIEPELLEVAENAANNFTKPLELTQDNDITNTFLKQRVQPV